MAYDESKDKLLKLFEMKKEKGLLLFSIFSYAGGQPKLGITRSFEKKDGTTGYGNAGRISVDEVKFLQEKLPEIINIMTNDKNSEKIS